MSRNSRNLRLRTDIRRTQLRRIIQAERLEDRHLLAAELTVITHGRMDQIFDDADVAPEWAFDLASAFNRRDGLGYSQEQIANSEMRYDSTDYSPPTDGAEGFLIFNWAEISDIDSPGKADDDEVAGVLAEMVRARYPDDGQPLDVHFIGHSRGAYVTLAAVNRLNTTDDNSRIANLTMTTLDPQAYGIPGINTEDIELVVPSNVDFAENYYQNLFPLGGGEMEGADVNQNLTIPLALWDGRSLLLGAEHLEVVDHYYWSIDDDDSQSADYLDNNDGDDALPLGDDLLDQQSVFETEFQNGESTLRDLLYGDSPLAQTFEMFQELAVEFSEGVGTFFTSFTNEFDERFGEIEIPILSDQLADVISPVVDRLRTFGSDVQDLFADVVEVASNAYNGDPLEVLRGALYMVLGPGSEGLDDLSQETADALAPLASRFDRINLNLLLDGPDPGDDVGPTDVTTSIGNEFGVHRPDNPAGSGDEPWFQLDFRLGQFEVIDLPEFDLGLTSLTTDPGLQSFFDTFGFEVTSENGIRTNLRWDLRLGFGVRGLPDQFVSERFFINSGATVSSLGTGEDIEEFVATITVFAAPPNSGTSETFATAIADETTTDNLRGELSLGLFQGTVSDGTPTDVKITATRGLDFGSTVGAGETLEILVTDQEGQYSIELDSPEPEADVVSLLLDLNTQLIDFYTGNESPRSRSLFPDIAFTVDFGSVHRQTDPDISTTPALVLAANNSNVSHLTIIGGDEYEFLPVQHEDSRSKTLGFGNNVSSDEDDDGEPNTLTATQPIPAGGVSLARPDFVLWIGGNRDGQEISGATAIRVAESLNAEVAVLDGLQQSMRQLQLINTPQAYAEAIELLVNQLIDSQTDFGPQKISVGLVEIGGQQHLQFSSDERLTVTYKGIEQTKLTLTAALDIVDPGFEPDRFDPEIEETYNRLQLSEISSDAFQPILKGEASVRLHVDTNTDNLDGFLEQALGVSDASIGLPTVDFDFVFDAAIDLSEAFNGGTGTEIGDIFRIDAMQFDNVVLDATDLLQTVVVPIVDAITTVFGPVLDIFGESVDDVEAAMNEPIPVISDLVGEDVSVYSILDSIPGVGEFVDVLFGLLSLSDELDSIINDPEFGSFALGGWELVMDPDSPLFFPTIDTPVPIHLAYAFESASFAFEDFVSVFSVIDTFSLPGLSIDIFKPGNVLNMAIGRPFDIISYGLPNIDESLEASFDFDWEVIQFEAEATFSLFANLRLAYDSTGIERVIGALKEGATPDWSDLIDGFGITTSTPDGNDPPDEDEVCVRTGEEEIYVCVTLSAEGGVDLEIASGSGNIEIAADLALDIIDPDGDGRLRLDEILDFTNNFEDPDQLFCMFDITGSAMFEVGGEVTLFGQNILDGSLGFDTGDLSLQDLLGSLFGICGDEVNRPILAESISENGVDVLRLNTGPFASARLYEDTDDSDGRVEYTVTQDGTDYTINATLYPDGSSFSQLISGDFDHVVATGTAFNDVFDLSTLTTRVEIDGRGGNDTILGGSASDILEGSEGDDRLEGGEGNDQMIAGPGNNTILDGPGDDLVDFRQNDQGVNLTTGGGRDIVLGSRFSDSITALPGSASGVSFQGGRGDDILVGAEGDDELLGGFGNDILIGGNGDDVIRGGFGDDHLDGGNGMDVLAGEQGNDTLVGGNDPDSIDAGQGNDDVTAGLADTVVQGGSGIQDQLHFVMNEFAHDGRVTRNSYTFGSTSTAYFGFESMDVVLGTPTDPNEYSLNVDGVRIPLTSITGSGGPDQVTITELSAGNTITNLLLGGNSDTVRVINTGRPIHVDGQEPGPNGNRLIVDQSGDPVSREGALSEMVVFGLTTGIIEYDNIEELDVLLGPGTDRFRIGSTSETTATTVQGGAGDDLFFIDSIAFRTSVSGQDGHDIATLIVPGAPNLLTNSDFGDLLATVEVLEIDNTQHIPEPGDPPIDWAFENDNVFVGQTEILSGLAADSVTFLGSQGESDSLTVRDNVPVPQTVTVDGDRVTIVEGFNIVDFSDRQRFERFNVQPIAEGLEGVNDSVVSPDGRFVYTSAAGESAVSVYRVTDSPESPGVNAIDFVQVLRNGELGVSGIDSASSIAMSDEGSFVYVSSGADHSVGIFERMPQTGRLVFRGSYSGSLGPILQIETAPNGESVFGITASTLFRLDRDTQTGRLTAAESNTSGGTLSDLVVTAEDVFILESGNISQWRLSSNDELETKAMDIERGNFTDLTIDTSSRTLFASFDGGISTISYDGAGMSSGIETPYLNGVNKALGVAVEYDRDDRRLVTSFDTTSVDPNPPNPVEYALDLISLYAEGAGQDAEGGAPEEWELYIKVYLFPADPENTDETLRFPVDADAYDDFADSGTTVTNFDAPISILEGQDYFVELWEEDNNGPDEFLGGIRFTTGIREWEIRYDVDDDVENAGFAVLRFAVIDQAPDPDPTPTTRPVVLFEPTFSSVNLSSLSVEDLPARPYLDSFSTSDATSDFFGVYTAADELRRFYRSSQGPNDFVSRGVRDFNLQTSFALPAAIGADEVETVVSADGRHVYASSSRYGTIAVYERDPTTGVVQDQPLQVIPAGLQQGATLAMTTPGSLSSSVQPQFLYVANPAEDSIQVYRRGNFDENEAYGKLELVQVVTDNVNGVNGIDGVSDLVLTDRLQNQQLFAVGPDDNAVTVFSIDRGTGYVTLESILTHPDIVEPSRITLAGGGPNGPANAMVTNRGNGALVVFDRAVDGTLTHLQSFFDGDVASDGLQHSLANASDIVAGSESTDGFEKYVFVSSSQNNSISVYRRDEFLTGELQLVQVLRDGINGARGIEGVSELAFHPGGDREFLYAGDNRDSLTVFQIRSGQLTQLQRVRSGTLGITGLEQITNLNVVGTQLYVGNGGLPGIGSGGFTILDSATVSLQTEPNEYIVDYAGIEDLTVQSASRDDIVQAGEIEIPFTLWTGDGSDQVTIRNTSPGRPGRATNTLLNLGGGDDELNLLDTASHSTTEVYGSLGRDTMRVFKTTANSELDLNGGEGGDTFYVVGRRLESNVSIDGQDPQAVAGNGNHDVLCFDPRVPGSDSVVTDPEPPMIGDGSIRIPNASFGVDYESIEEFCADFAAPLATLESGSEIAEGDGLTLDASATVVSPLHSEVRYVWSISAAESIATGPTAALTWEQLSAAGIDDDGRYQIRVVVTSIDENGLQYSDIATADLIVTNTAPSYSIPSGNTEVGFPYRFDLAAFDPGEDTIATWWVDWGDGSLPDRIFGDQATAEHVYQRAGLYDVSVTAVDEDGRYDFTPQGLVTVSEAPKLTPAESSTIVIEGTDFLLRLDAPGATPIDEWLIDWGDGQRETVNPDAIAVHRYLDDGIYEVTGSVVADGREVALGSSLFVHVINAVPSLSGPSQPLTIDQGQELSLELFGNDLGLSDGVWTFEIDWDNNRFYETIVPESDSSTTSVGFSETARTTFTRVGLHTISTRLRDKDNGLSATVPFEVHVENVAPTILGVSAPVGFEGSLVQVSVDATDPGGVDDRLTYFFDFDNDGIFEIETGANRSGFVPADNGVYPVNVRVIDSHGGIAEVSVAVSVDNVAPSFKRPTVEGQIIEGTTATLRVRGSDPAGENDPLTYRFDLNNDGQFDVINSTGTVPFSFPDDGTYFIPIEISDDDGGVTDVLFEQDILDDQGQKIGTERVPFQVVVFNGNPVIESINTFDITENQTVTVSGTFSDPALGVDTESFSGSATWSDGVETVLIVEPDGTFQTTRFFADDDPSGTPFDSFTVELFITDDDGGVTLVETVVTEPCEDEWCTTVVRSPVISSPITVSNVPPVIETVMSDSASPAEKSEDKRVAISGSFSDTGTLDTHTVWVDWGDSTPPQLANVDQAERSFSANYEYATPGIYTISVTVVDDDLGQSEPMTTTAVLQGVGIVGDTLYIVGTDLRDHIAFQYFDQSAEIAVRAIFAQDTAEQEIVVERFPASSIQTIVAFLCGGDDHYNGDLGGAENKVNSSPTSPLVSHVVLAGDGKDVIHGGDGNDALLGGSGNDQLKGGNGHDLIVGGEDSDQLHGHFGDDLLIGDVTGLDSTDVATLMAIQSSLDFWNAGNLLGAIAALRGINDDSAKDRLFDRKGENEFFEGGYQPTWAATFDVNGDGRVTPSDALLIINQIASGGSGNLPQTSLHNEELTRFDINDDQLISASDGLNVINAIANNRRSEQTETDSSEIAPWHAKVDSVMTLQGEDKKEARDEETLPRLF